MSNIERFMSGVRHRWASSVKDGSVLRVYHESENDFARLWTDRIRLIASDKTGQIQVTLNINCKKVTQELACNVFSYGEDQAMIIAKHLRIETKKRMK